jgi:tetrahydromethanopterin S-methyltransferase subunit F
MSNESQIEEILMEANSMGFREELIETVAQLLDTQKVSSLVDTYEYAFQLILRNTKSK